MSLVTLATEENWQAFDDSWAELMGGDGPVDELLEALEVVGQKRRMSRCMPMVRDHAEILIAGERPAEAAEVLGTSLRGGGAVGEISELLLSTARAAWGEEPWWDAFCETAELHAGTSDMRLAWNYFHDMKHYRTGLVIFHAAGWGAGEVTGVDPEKLEVDVTFQSGRRDRFPLRTAVEIFEVLPETDLRAMAMRDPDGIKKMMKKEPLEILKSLLFRFGGKASNMALRNAMMQIGVTGNTWSSWWRKTRLLAENSEWFRVTGNASRAEVEMLRRAVDPVEGLRTQLRHAPTLKDALTRVRDLLGGAKLEEEVRAVALDTLEKLVQDEGQPLEHRMATWMLLREHRGATPETLIEALRATADAEVPVDPAVPPPFWARLRVIPGSREQERSVDLLQEVYGDAWIDQAVLHLPHASPGMVPGLIDALRSAGHDDALVAHYSKLLARPLRSPFVLIGLARLAEEGKVKGDMPTPVQRAQALIELAVYLQGARRGNPILARAQERLTVLLTSGEPPLLERMLDGAEIAALANFRAMMQRGVDDKIDIMITDICLEHGPELFATDAHGFWDDDVIWTTRAALERRQEELRVLLEVKIPENSEAIGRAADYGDLSENAEWEQAIEQQRMLTEQAKSMELELAKASLLENATLPEDTVCPGVTVEYREVASGEQSTLTLLGPWDGDREHAVSYRAPLAAGMLGLHAGDKISIQLPSGSVDVEILTIAHTTL
jgi:transcription elongation factor GreA